jgi:hypothetical protein
VNLEPNLVLESEHLAINIDLAARAPQYGVRVVVATRYCVLPVEETGALSPRRQDELVGWLARREELFCAWTLPSMLAQAQEPVWVLLVDRRLVHIVAPRLQADLPGWAYIVPVEPGQASSSRLGQVIKPDAVSWTVTARVDNDDAVAVDYCKALAIWTSLATPDECLLSFPIGAQASAGGAFAPRLTTAVTGHFSAYVTPPGGRLNKALAYMHTEVYRGGLDVPVRQLVTTQPMWVEVLHDQNVANHARPGPALTSDQAYWSRRMGWS